MKDNNLKVWWSSRVPITDLSLEGYFVNSIKEARQKIKELTDRDLKDNSITDNVGGLEIFEDGEWSEWYCPNEDCCEDIDRCECEYK